MKYLLAIFDLDGTILNTLQDLADSTNAIMKKFEFPEHSVDNVRLMVGNGIPKLIERAIPDGVNNPKYNQVLADFIDYYRNHCEIKTAPYDGMIEAFKALKSAGVKIAVNTNKDETAAKKLCDNYFPDLIDYVSGGRKGKHHKPDPVGVYEIFNHFGFECSSDCKKAVFIGDSEVDIQTGTNAGLDAIGCAWGFRGKDFLAQHGAKIIVMTPSEMAKVILGIG